MIFRTMFHKELPKKSKALCAKISFSKTLAISAAAFSTSLISASSFAQTASVADLTALVAPLQTSITFLKSADAAESLGRFVTALQTRLNTSEAIAACGADIGASNEYAVPTIRALPGTALACSEEARSAVLGTIPANNCAYIIFQGTPGTDLDSRIASGERSSDVLVPSNYSDNNLSVLVSCNSTAAAIPLPEVRATNYSGNPAYGLVVRLNVPAASVPQGNRRTNSGAATNMNPASDADRTAAQASLQTALTAHQARLQSMRLTGHVSTSSVYSLLIPSEGQGTAYANLAAASLTPPSGNATSQMNLSPLDPLAAGRCALIAAQAAGSGGDMDLSLAASGPVSFLIDDHGESDDQTDSSPFVFACNRGSAPVNLTVGARQYRAGQTHAGVIARIDVDAPSAESMAAVGIASAVAGLKADGWQRSSGAAGVMSDNLNSIPAAAFSSANAETLNHCGFSFTAGSSNTAFANLSIQARPAATNGCTEEQARAINAAVAPNQCAVVVASGSGDFDLRSTNPTNAAVTISSDAGTSATSINIICNGTPEGQTTAPAPRAFTLQGRQYTAGQATTGTIARFNIASSVVPGTNVNSAPLSDAEGITALQTGISSIVTEARGLSADQVSGLAQLEQLKIQALTRFGNTILQANDRSPVCGALIRQGDFNGVNIAARTGAHACTQAQVDRFRAALAPGQCRLIVAQSLTRPGTPSDIDLSVVGMGAQDQEVIGSRDVTLTNTPATLICSQSGDGNVTRVMVQGMNAQTAPTAAGTPALITYAEFPLAQLAPAAPAAAAPARR